ncbi:MAG: hypothetical protein DRQ89_12465 [Epsilonproteobacteria bacterium]|nr:MAG: hypothetical protein DRQ89_12465 [Campylobacterota bacterium]
MGGRRTGDNAEMCSSEEVQEINDHTDKAVEILHKDDEQISGQVHALEARFTDKVEAVKEEFKEEVAEVKKEFKGDINIVFDQLTDIRKSVGRSTGVQLTVLIFLFGMLFNWLWDNEQARDTQQMRNTEVLAVTTTVQATLAEDVKDIASMMKGELDENHKEHLDNHRKYEHPEIE